MDMPAHLCGPGLQCNGDIEVQAWNPESASLDPTDPDLLCSVHIANYPLRGFFHLPLKHLLLVTVRDRISDWIVSLIQCGNFSGRLMLINVLFMYVVGGILINAQNLEASNCSISLLTYTHTSLNVPHIFWCPWLSMGVSTVACKRPKQNLGIV